MELLNNLVIDNYSNSEISKTIEQAHLSREMERDSDGAKASLDAHIIKIRPSLVANVKQEIGSAAFKTHNFFVALIINFLLLIGYYDSSINARIAQSISHKTKETQKTVTDNFLNKIQKIRSPKTSYHLLRKPVETSSSSKSQTADYLQKRYYQPTYITDDSDDELDIGSTSTTQLRNPFYTTNASVSESVRLKNYQLTSIHQNHLLRNE